MPQMAPYNWLLLNSMFLMIFIMLIMIIHFYNLKIFKLNYMKKIFFNKKIIYKW